MPQIPFTKMQAAFMRALPGISRGLRGRRLPFALFLGLLVLVGYLAARLTWQFALPPSASRRGIAEPTAAAQSGRRNQSPAARIAAAHLFGTTAGGQARQTAAENAPETTLNLTLLGVAAGTSGAPSRAIISNGASGDQNTYKVGDTLPGGAVIRAMFPDRVVIAHHGHLETLRLPVAGTSLLASHMTFGQRQGGRLRPSPRLPGAPAAGFSPQRVRRQLEQHPEAVSRFLQLRPYANNGHLKGYRVYPGQYPELFRRVGLQPGDIVTSVNGIDLDSPKAGRQALSRIKQAHGPLHLVVLRHGEPVHVTVNLPGSQI